MMGGYSCFSLLLAILCLVKTIQCQSLKFLITPSEVILSQSSQMTVNVSCQAEGDKTGLEAVDIKRKARKENCDTKERLCFVSSVLPSGKKKLESLAGTVAGDFTQGIIRLLMTTVSCSDNSLYTCTMTASTQSLEKDVALLVKEAPGTPVMTGPPAKSSSAVNEKLTMMCKGSVGWASAPSEVSWIWEYRNNGSNWVAVESSASATSSELMSGTTECSKEQSSTLVVTLTKADDQREYRCYVHNKGMNMKDPNLSAVHKVGLVTGTDSGKKPGGHGKRSSEASVVLTVLGILTSGRLAK